MVEEINDSLNHGLWGLMGFHGKALIALMPINSPYQKSVQSNNPFPSVIQTFSRAIQ